MKNKSAIILSGILLMGIQASASTVLFEDSFEDYANGYQFNNTSTPFTATGNFTGQVAETPIALFGDKAYWVAREHSLDANTNGHLRTSINFRPNNKNSIYAAQAWLYIGSRTPTTNSTQVSSIFGTFMWNQSLEVMARVSFDTTRRNATPVLRYTDGGNVTVVNLYGEGAPFQFSADTWYGINMTVNEITQRYSFEILDTNSIVLFSVENLELANDGQFNYYSIYMQSNHRNDGFNNYADGVSISLIPEPSTYAFGAALITMLFAVSYMRRKNRL